MDGILGNGARAPEAEGEKILATDEIVWRRVAVNDLEGIRRYIAQENPAAGARIRAMIRTAVEQLVNHPNLGRSGRVDGTRELVVAGTSYIVVYRVLENRLRILSVIHGARKWPEHF